jgi:alcohol dehydrogenase (cytochrome c)
MKAFTRARLKIALVLLFAFAAAIAASLLDPDVRWRAQVVWLKLSGDLPAIPAAQVLTWMQPGSSVYLGALAEQPSPNASIRNLGADRPEYVSAGRKQFQTSCSHCHGADGKGGSGPNLLAFITRTTEWDFLSTVKWGRSGTAMAAQPISDEQIWQVHSFLRGEARVWVTESAADEVGRSIDVPYAKLAEAEKYPEDWLAYGGNLAAHRHSSLTQINRSNVASLKVAWTAQLRPSTKPLAATPIATGGLIFVTEAPEGVLALDAKTGAVVWRYRRSIDPSKLPLCCGAFNRGVAILGSRVFVATLDAHLVALDAASGRLVWDVQVADPAKGFSMTNAPLVTEGHLVVGVAGGEFGIRGFVAAFSPEDGKRLWQFEAIPGKGEPGNETWAGDSWKTGGASTWTTGVYDKQLDLIYWTTGNPWPPLDGRVRRGDNLYSNSVVALERKTGKLKWHYQFTPADTHDWDATQQAVLVDVNWKGQKVPALILANRNAFYYVIDRRDGRFLSATPFVKQTWATGFDAKGRPSADPASEPSPKGTLVWPWMHGGTNWWSPSYDPTRKLHFVPTVDAATLYFSVDMSYQAATMTMGGTTRLATNQPAVMAVKAIDPETGAARWTTRLDKGDFHQFSRIAGLLSTDGGLVFAGFDDRILALDADSGKELWRFSPGGLTNAGSATYTVDGVQYFTLIAGNVLFAFKLGSAN